MPSVISAGTTAGTAIAITGDTTGNLAFQTNGTTTAMTITTAQNVGVGTTTPDRPLVVTSSSDAMTISQTGGGVGLQMSQSSVNDVLLRMTNSSGHYWDIRNQGSGSQLLIGGFFGDTLRLGTTGNLQFNSGYGSVATAYGCRAWVNFDGTTSPGTIRGSGNVSSVSRTGTGAYTINFTTSMPDSNYSVVGIANADSRTVSVGNLLAGSAAMRTTNSAGALENQTLVAIAVFR
jgi:hypothetical protein